MSISARLLGVVGATFLGLGIVAESAWRVSAEEPPAAAVAIERIPWADQAGESAAVIVPTLPLVHTTQLLPIVDDGKVPEGDSTQQQLTRLFDRLAATLASSGSSLQEVVKLNVYVADDESAAQARVQIAKRFAGHLPAVCYVVTRLPQPHAKVALDAIAVSRQELPPTGVKYLPASRADSVESAAAVLPAGSYVYVAGQAEKGDLREATRRTLESLDATLKFLQLEWADVAQIKSFVTPMAEVHAAEDEVRKFLGQRPVPPLAWVEWESGLPIEIELVVGANRGRKSAADSLDVEFLAPPGMTTPTIYSRVTRTHSPRLIYLGGFYGKPETAGGTQVEQIFGKMRVVLEKAGSDFEHLAKATYYVSDNDASAKLNELRPRYYNPKRPPAASKAMVRGVGLRGATITIDMIATPRPRQ